MVIAALISRPFLPTAGPISVKSVYNRHALLLRYLVHKKLCHFLTNYCWFGQGHIQGHLGVVSARITRNTISGTTF
jgi:hypothetical protein